VNATILDHNGLHAFKLLFYSHKVILLQYQFDSLTLRHARSSYVLTVGGGFLLSPAYAEESYLDFPRLLQDNAALVSKWM